MLLVASATYKFIVSVLHDWSNMVDEVQKYVKSLNFGYRKVLRERSVTYLNAYAQFVDAHTVKVSLCFDQD